jgi:hypothetical protein
MITTCVQDLNNIETSPSLPWRHLFSFSPHLSNGIPALGTPTFSDNRLYTKRIATDSLVLHNTFSHIGMTFPLIKVTRTNRLTKPGPHWTRVCPHWTRVWKIFTSPKVDEPILAGRLNRRPTFEPKVVMKETENCVLHNLESQLWAIGCVEIFSSIWVA